MARRIKIGIIYSYDENWIGGTYYYQYLIQSLNLLPLNEKPHIVILTKTIKEFESIKKLSYPFISYHLLNNKLSFFKLIKYKLTNKTNHLINKINYGIDVLFHPSELKIPNTIEKHLYWIPDFQEMYLPDLFSKEYLEYRKKTQKEILKKDYNILFSSNDALKDFNLLYPNALSNTYVVNFAVFHPDFKSLNIIDIKDKYNISNDVKYFFCPNQFWKHKNHLVVFKAINYIVKKFNVKFKVLFSGKEVDIRHPNYFIELKQFVTENELNEYIDFLGFIDRKEQLSLMDNALGIIQPSFFEGWSSTVEDVKSINQNVIASSLKVHREQLQDKAFYFDPNNEKELAECMLLFLRNEIKRPEFNYYKNLHLFGSNFMDVIKKIIE